MNRKPVRDRRWTRWAARTETTVLVVILVGVGILAGKVSFTHVHDWTMDNSPSGTPQSAGWTNAVISELVPIACALVIRRRRRAGRGFMFPLVLLVAAVLLSLAAQLAVAKPGISGCLLSAVPSLAFIALTKLILGDSTSDNRPDTAAASVSDSVSGSVGTPETTPEPTTARDTGATAASAPTASPSAIPARPTVSSAATPVSGSTAAPNLPALPASVPGGTAIRNGAIPSGVIR